MGHICEECGHACYCDCDDLMCFEQPSNCKHIVRPDLYCDAYESDDEDYYEEDPGDYYHDGPMETPPTKEAE